MDHVRSAAGRVRSDRLFLCQPAPAALGPLAHGRRWPTRSRGPGPGGIRALRTTARMNTLVSYGVAGALLLAVSAYSTAGGTDYGAGIWDLLAGRFRHTAEVRALIDHAMAPVWEANNVWLVFSAVICWTGFPLLYESVFLSLYPLFALALLALILRGAFFAFRKVATSATSRLLASRVFGLSSLLAPFSFAAALGAIASGKVGVGGPVVPIWQACLDPLAIAFGAVALTATAFSGASFLVGDARRYRASHEQGPDLVEYFRRRTVEAAVALLGVSLVVLLLIAAESPTAFRGMVEIGRAHV